METPFTPGAIPKSCYKKVASFEEFTIGIRPDNSVEVLRNGDVLDQRKVRPLLRDKIALMVGFRVDSSWNTHQLGSKLVNFINHNNSIPKSQTNKKGSGKTKKTNNMTNKGNHLSERQFLRNIINNCPNSQGKKDIINIMQSIANHINNSQNLNVSGYTMHRNILKQLFKTTSGKKQYSIQSIMLRLTTLDSMYSTNASKSYYAIEEMAEEIWNIPGIETNRENRASRFFNEVATGIQTASNNVNVDSWFNKQFGIQKNGKTGHRKTSLLSKYAYYCLLLDNNSDGFPIYDSLAVASIPFAFNILWPGTKNSQNLKKLVKAFSSESSSQREIPISLYIEAMKTLCDGLGLTNLTFPYFQKFDILDAYLWRMGKFSNGNLSLLLDKQGYEDVLTVLTLKEDPTLDKTMSDYYERIADKNKDILNETIVTYNKKKKIFFTNGYPTICDNKACKEKIVGSKNQRYSGDVNALVLFSMIKNARNKPNIFANHTYLNALYHHWCQYYMY